MKKFVFFAVKVIAVLAVAALVIFIFVPFGKIRAKINTAVSKKLRAAGADVTFRSIDTDFFRTITINGLRIVMDTPSGKRTVKLEKAALYFRTLFLFTGDRMVRKIYLSGSDISLERGESADLAGLFSVPGAPAEAAPPVRIVFRDITVREKTLSRTFHTEGAIDLQGHPAVKIRLWSDGFRAYIKASRPDAGAGWNFRASMKKLDFFNVFISTPRIRGGVFSGDVSGSFAGGKFSGLTIGGELSASSAVILNSKVPDGRLAFTGVSCDALLKDNLLHMKNFKALFNGTALNGEVNIRNVTSRAVLKADLAAAGDLKYGGFEIKGMDAALNVAGFAENPALTLSGRASSVKKDGYVLKNCTAQISFNERNSGEFGIKKVSGTLLGFSISASGRAGAGGVTLSGIFNGTLGRGACRARAYGTFVSSSSIFLRPEVKFTCARTTGTLKGTAEFSEGNGKFALFDAPGNIKTSGRFIAGHGSVKIPEFDASFKSSRLSLKNALYSYSDKYRSLRGALSVEANGSYDGELSASLAGGRASVSFTGDSASVYYFQNFAGEDKPFLLKAGLPKGSVRIKGRVRGIAASGKITVKGKDGTEMFGSGFRASASALDLESFRAGKYLSGSLHFGDKISGSVKAGPAPPDMPYGLLKGAVADIKIKDGLYKATVNSGGKVYGASGKIGLEGFGKIYIDAKSEKFEGTAQAGFSLFGPAEARVEKARFYIGGGYLDVKSADFRLKRKKAGITLAARNVGAGPFNIFSNADFSVDYSSGIIMDGTLNDTFVNDFYFPVHLSVSVRGGTAKFIPRGGSRGITGEVKNGSGALTISDGGQTVNVKVEKNGAFSLESQSVSLQKILKLLRVDLPAFGDVKARLDSSKGKMRLELESGNIFVGSQVGISGSIETDGDSIYPQLTVKAPGGDVEISGYLAEAPGGVNNLTVKINNLYVPRLLYTSGEIDKLSANGDIFVGGTYELPEVKGFCDVSFEAGNVNYPQKVSVDARAVFNGRSCAVNGTGALNGKQFRLKSGISFASGNISAYSVSLTLPEKGVPIVVPGLLIHRKSILKYILSPKPSHGLVSGNISLANDGGKNSVKGALSVRNAKFSYKSNPFGIGGTGNTEFSLKIKFDKNVEWISDNFNADIYGALDIEGPPYKVNGTIASSRGTLNYLGKTLDIDFAQVEFADNKSFLTLKASAEVTRKRPTPPFDEVQDTISIDIRHSPMDSLDIKLGSERFSNTTSQNQAYQLLAGGANGKDMEFMKREIAKLVDSSVVGPVLSDIVQDAGIADDVRVSLPAVETMTRPNSKLSALDNPESMNLYMGKSFGRIRVGYSLDLTKDISAIDLRHGLEMMYRLGGNNVIRAQYLTDEEGRPKKYIGVEKHIRF